MVIYFIVDDETTEEALVDYIRKCRSTQIAELNVREKIKKTIKVFLLAILNLKTKLTKPVSDQKE